MDPPPSVAAWLARYAGKPQPPIDWDILPVHLDRPRSVHELLEHYPDWNRKEARRLMFLMYLVDRGKVS